MPPGLVVIYGLGGIVSHILLSMTAGPLDFMPYVKAVNDYCSAFAVTTPHRAFNAVCVGGHLRTLAENHDYDPAYHALADACTYILAQPGSEGHAIWGVFMPITWPLDMNGAHAYPVSLDQVSEQTLSLWSRCAGVDGLHPLVRARLADLLWVRQHSDVPGWDRTAVCAYIEAAGLAEIYADERMRGLLRAMDICQESPLGELLGPVLDASASLKAE